MNYKISIPNPDTHFILLEWEIKNIHQSLMHLQIPAWRPGRYELANYAKNVRCFAIKNEKGENVPFRKITKDCWEVNTEKCKALKVTYEYYTNQYDAGASYADASQLYVNPVNCMMYAEGRMDEPCTVELAVPDDYKIACQLSVKGKNLHAESFDQLADSPFIASASLQHHSFKVADTQIHFWFQGAHNFDIAQLEQDTIAYTLSQIKIYGELPCKNYHFLYHILPHPFRHGVEHCNSTVITMGQGENETREEFYDSLLAISSHELFHLWNIKRIRPVEMLPYDFTKENYSTLGYVYEGVTTYYGDQILLRCRAWNWEQYCESFNNDLRRHFDNAGRFNYSVSASSWDTWLDGYVAGVAGRKVSIYIEGMLAALIADILIITHSKGKYSLDNVMNALYENYKHGKGYDEEIYRKLLDKFAGISFENYFKEVIHGCGYIEKYLREQLSEIGCELRELNGQQRIFRIANPTKMQELNFNFWLTR